LPLDLKVAILPSRSARLVGKNGAEGAGDLLEAHIAQHVFRADRK
jgi:hypothetical protein